MTPAKPVNDLGTGGGNLLNSIPEQPLHASKIGL